VRAVVQLKIFGDFPPAKMPHRGLAYCEAWLGADAQNARSRCGNLRSAQAPEVGRRLRFCVALALPTSVLDWVFSWALLVPRRQTSGRAAVLRSTELFTETPIP
jgi:hypothetical protein